MPVCRLLAFLFPRSDSPLRIPHPPNPPFFHTPTHMRAEFIDSLLPKVEWAALKEGAKCLNLEGDAEQLPATAEEVSALSRVG